MIALLLILVLLTVSLLLHAVAIKFGAKWAKVPGVTFRRAVGVTLVLTLMSLVLGAVVEWFSAQVKLTPLAAILLPLAVMAVAESLTLSILLRTSAWRGILVWLPKIGATAVMLALLFLVVKPFVVEGFIQSGHGMAPTLLGLNSPGTCPHCGGPATMGVDPQAPPRDSLGMCSVCQQPGEVQGRPQILATPADRFVVCKFLPPARWDVVAVRTPTDPPALVAKRLVGLPGEEVVIRDGGIWINGTKQEPPADIAKLTFTTAAEATPDRFGSPERPTQLGPDEYFVVGDFSLRSSDSRYWGPVPRKNIEGVVSLIYFPVYRWRLLK